MRGRLFDPRLGRFTTPDPVITDAFNGQTLNAFVYVRNNPLVFVDPSGFSEEEAWRLWSNHESPGQLGVHITYNQLTPPPPRLANRAEINANAPTNDTSTTGTPPIVIPVVETDHPSGQGTDDPFGVFPTDLEFEDHSPITPFEQLVNGGPAGGRNFFLSESDPGFATSLNHAFGPPRQTISLQGRWGGDARDLRTAAKDRLIGEGILLGATILTPTPLDDMAAAGLRSGTRLLRGGPRAVAAGKEGEAAVRAVVDIGEKKPYKINGRKRIPDGIKGKILSEVKNVDKLSHTRQLRDYASIAKREGLDFHLYVKPSTKLSSKLQRLVDDGTIIRRFIP